MSFCETESTVSEWSTVSDLSDDEEPTFEKKWTSYFYIQIYGEDYTEFDKYNNLKNKVSDEVYIRTLAMNRCTIDDNPDHWVIITIDEAHSKVYIHRKLMPSSTILRAVAEFIEEITWYHENAPDDDGTVSVDSPNDPC